MSNERIIPYEGNEPYIFISYSHLDPKRVMPILRRIQNDGYRIWYDDGIEAGSKWAENIEKHLVNSSCMMAFITENYMKNENCLDEIEHAKNKGINILRIYLEDVKVNGCFEMRHGRTQAVLKSHYDSEESFYKRIYSAKILETSKQITYTEECIESPVKPLNQVGDSVEEYMEFDLIINNIEKLKTKIQNILSDNIKFLIEMAEDGDTEAQYSLGESYYYGDSGVEKNYQEAVKWFIKSAENGNVDAQRWLGNFYYLGEDVEENFEEAVKWYKMAANQGDTWSIHILEDNNIQY